MTKGKDFCECCGTEKAPEKKRTEGSKVLLRQKLKALQKRQEELETELGKVVKQIAAAERELDE